MSNNTPYAESTVLVVPAHGVTFLRQSVTATGTAVATVQVITTAVGSYLNVIAKAEGADLKIGLTGFTTHYFTLLDGQSVMLPYCGTALYTKTVSGTGHIEVIVLKE